MPKSLAEDLAEWVKKREATRPRQDKNVVAFLALKGHVQDSIAAGYSLLTIWEHLHDKGRISYRYETFLRHVRRHIKSRPPAVDGQPPSPPTLPSPSVVEKTAASRPQQPKPAPSVPAGFKFDSQPNKEDLL